MKKIFLAAVLLTSISGFANEGIKPAIVSTTGVTLLPFILPTEMSQLSSMEYRVAAQAVRDDAIDFLGEEVMTEKLEETIDAFKASVPELKNATDEEIASAIVAM